MKFFLKFCFLSFVLGFFAVAGFLTYLYYDLPSIQDIKNYKPPTPSVMEARGGEVLLQLGSENRKLANLAEIPTCLQHAFLAAEDKDFYNHPGVNFVALLRALMVDITHMRLQQGGSTITQQLAIGLYLHRRGNLWQKIKRKFRDILLALKIEKKLTKDEILELYLNQVYLGSGFYGVRAASKGYFNKKMSELSPAECALIAGINAAPGRYSPLLNPVFSKRRQNYVLQQMKLNQFITEKEWLAAKNTHLELIRGKEQNQSAMYFSHWIKKLVEQQLEKKELHSQGLKIKTTLDFDLQLKAERSLQKGLEAIHNRQGYFAKHQRITAAKKLAQKDLQLKKSLLKKSRKKFTLLTDGSVHYPGIEKDQTYLELIEAEYKKILQGKQKKIRYFSESIFNLLKEFQLRSGIVTGWSNDAQSFYVALGGVSCVVKKEDFSWALKTWKKGRRFEQRLSSVFRKGDVIKVRILKKEPSQQRVYCEVYQKTKLEGAVFAMEATTGEILAYVGGKDFLTSQFDRTHQAQRQPGSVFKPFIFAAALEDNRTAASIIFDTPQALAGVDRSMSWKPRNYDGKFKGPITLRQALEQSRNIPTVKLANQLSYPRIIDFAERFGFERKKLNADMSIALGSFGTNVMEMARAYTPFVNKGFLVSPYGVEEINNDVGEPFWLKGNFLHPKNPEQVYDERLAYVMHNLLQGVVKNGTAVSAKNLSKNIAGKTGTTNDYVDAWFVGYSHNVVIAVWVGNDDNSKMAYGESGGKAALPIWKDIMADALKRYEDLELEEPEGVVKILINSTTGRTVYNENDSIHEEVFVEGTEPERLKNQNIIKFKSSYDEDYYNYQ